MKLVKYDPRPSWGLFDEIDRVFGSSFGMGNRLNFFDDVFCNRSHERLNADIYEDADNYYVRLELPGVKKKEVEIGYEDDFLTISGEHVEKKDKDERRLSFNRSIAVPTGVNADKIKAKLSDGILTVTLPKEEAKKPKSIAVS